MTTGCSGSSGRTRPAPTSSSAPSTPPTRPASTRPWPGPAPRSGPGPRWTSTRGAAAVRAGADRIAAEVDDLAVLMARETGKVLADCRGELRLLGDRAALGRRPAPRSCWPTRSSTTRPAGCCMRRRPYGVVAAVTPVERAGHPGRPQARPGAGRRQRGGREAVAAGAVRDRPGRRAARRRAARRARVQVVQGDAETATALVGHPGVDRVAFTGGEHAGRAIAALAGQSLTPTLMELGGNDPAILLDDADLGPDAMDRLVMATFATSGQVCMAVKRLLRAAQPARRGRRGLPRRRRPGAPARRPAARRRHPRAGRDRRVGDPGARAWSTTRSARGAEAFVLGAADPATDLGRGYFLRPDAGARRRRPRPRWSPRSSSARPSRCWPTTRVDEARRPRQRRRPRAGRLGVVGRRGPRLRGRRAARRRLHVRQHAQPHRHVAARAVRRGQALRLGSGVRRRGAARAHPAVRGPRSRGVPAGGAGLGASAYPG